MSHPKWSSWRQDNFLFFKTHLGDMGDLLDVGVGEAQFFDLYKTARTYTAIDWKSYPKVTIVADITKSFPFSSIFDTVVLSNTLEHIFKPNHVVSEVYRVLRPGGRVLGTIPFIRDVHQAPHDFHRYTHFAIRQYLLEAGFKNIILVPLGSPQSVFKLVLSLYIKHIPDSFKKMIFEKCTGWIQRFFVFDMPANYDFCEGYGFTAEK